MSKLHVSRRTVVGSLGAGLLMTASRGAFAAPVTLDALKKAGEVRVGCEAAYVPFTYRDNAGKIIGFDVDFATKMFEPIGVKPLFIDTQWSGVIPALYAGRFDMVPTMSYTKERLERVLFSIPYADASQALLIRSADKDKIKTIADMSGKVLGIKLGSPGETLKNRLETQLKTERGAGFKDVKTYDDHPAAYLALAQGSVDGVLNTVPTLAVVLRDKPGGVRGPGHARRAEESRRSARRMRSRLRAFHLPRQYRQDHRLRRRLRHQDVRADRRETHVHRHAMVRRDPGALRRPFRYGPDHELHQGTARAGAVQHPLCRRIAGAAHPRSRQGQDQVDRRHVGEGARHQARIARRNP
ncbi:MAG TPA: transporter substrate-binding domain-containing protein, partial [Xanthobacteraceae bacterium]|nr:transporter substrate-binding domain-containing protein [Xanthobacteraceae bacterium]